MTEVVRPIGAVAGLAAVLGLAVLAILYVRHAREVRRLRRWAGGGPERSRPARRSARRLGVRAVALALVGLLCLGGAVAYGIGRLTGDRPATAPTAAETPRPRPATVKPGAVTVAVLNGTTVPGLAASLRDQLAAAGFATGMIDVSSDQTRAASVVQYTPGHAAAAAAVGRRLGIARRASATPDARARAGDAIVIVIAGADKAP